MLSESPLYQSVVHRKDINTELAMIPELLPDTQWIVDIFEDETNAAMMAIPAQIRHWNVNIRCEYYQNAPTPEIRAMVERKIYHTRDVDNKAYELAQKNSKLKNPEFNLNISQMMANADLHDAGRFPQAFYFQTFNDDISFDHAHMSSDMADAADFSYDENNLQRESTLGPVKEHSRIECTDDANYHILRDVDKLIIAKEYIADLEKEIMDAGLEGKELRTSELNEEAIEQLRQGKSISNALARESKANRILQRIAWIHNFHFDIAKLDFIQSGSLNNLLNLLDIYTGGTNDEIKNIVNEWQAKVQRSPIFTESLQNERVME